jgi:hypothetical protein
VSVKTSLNRDKTAAPDLATYPKAIWSLFVSPATPMCDRVALSATRKYWLGRDRAYQAAEK